MTLAAPLLLENVTHAFAGGAAVVEGVAMNVPAGQFVSLVGPSGCGKSTLLRLLADLIRPSSGTVQVGKPRGAPSRKAFVFQDPTLLPWRTVRENVALPLEVERVRDSGQVTKAIELVGLRAEDVQKFPRELSGGMRMRVSLARAMVMEPDLMLLDEPFAALDDLLRQQLNEEVLRLWGQRGWTAVFVTHNVAEAVFLSQRVLVMSARPGRIVADIPVPFAYPRAPKLRAEPNFAALVGVISDHLRTGGHK
jgi:NitT/TauT family transport system ATP-binding protein